MTGVECMVWDQLRRRQVARARFRRQAPIGDYVVDFLCIADRLIVEVDGPTHDFTVEADDRRTRWLQSKGYRVLRFTADEILADPETVWLSVEAELATPNSVIGQG
jgi:very-short-patch-repair endonuclease